MYGNRKRRNALGTVVGILALIAIAAGLLLIHRWETRNDNKPAEPAVITPQSDETENQIRYQGKWYKENTDIEKILLIGLDKYDTQIYPSEGEFRNDQQSDFLALILLNRTDGRYRVLFLNRDTMADVPMLDINGKVYDTSQMQLALSHTYGDGGELSCRNTVQAVSNLLYGVKIDHYVSVTMDAVQLLNDMVGGVPVLVEDDFSYIDYTLTQGEEVNLLGEHALTFVRARSGMDDASNLARMERQRVYLKSLRKRALNSIAKDNNFAMKALLELSDYMTSDCTIDSLAVYFDAVSRNGEPEILTLDGEATYGSQFVEYHVDEEALQAKVMELFYTPVEDY